MDGEHIDSRTNFSALTGWTGPHGFLESKMREKALLSYLPKDTVRWGQSCILQQRGASHAWFRESHFVLLEHIHAQDNSLASLPSGSCFEANQRLQREPSCFQQLFLKHLTSFSDQSWGLKLLKPVLLQSNESRSSQNNQHLPDSLFECFCTAEPQAHCGMGLFTKSIFRFSPPLP